MPLVLATHLPSHSRQAPERLSARDGSLICNLQKVVANEMRVTFASEPGEPSANRTLGTTLGCLFCPKWWLLGYAQMGHANYLPTYDKLIKPMKSRAPGIVRRTRHHGCRRRDDASAGDPQPAPVPEPAAPSESEIHGL